MIGDMLSFDHLHIVKSQIWQGLWIKVIRSFLAISAALSRTSNALRLKRCSPIGRNATQGALRIYLWFAEYRTLPHLMDAELYPFSSPNPNELLDYRRKIHWMKPLRFGKHRLKQNLIRGLKCDRILIR